MEAESSTEEPETNILMFPRDKIVRTPINDVDGEIAKMKEASLTNFASAMAIGLAENIIMNFHNHGIDIECDEFVKDFSITMAFLVATVYRSMGVHHPMHKFINEQVVVKEVPAAPGGGKVFMVEIPFAGANSSTNFGIFSEGTD